LLQISKYCHFCTNRRLINLKTIHRGKNQLVFFQELLYELTVTSLFSVGILKCDIFFFFFFIIKCQECNKNRQNVFSTTNYFAIIQRINILYNGFSNNAIDINDFLCKILGYLLVVVVFLKSYFLWKILNIFVQSTW
jgi:hypothetical protein